MKIIDEDAIKQSGLLTPTNALAWVREAFSLKYQARLPHKISITYGEGNFMNTMPCMVPELGVYGVKVVTRFPRRIPSICGDLLLYSDQSGELLSLMSATSLTSMRTGAVAAVAIETFSKSDFREIGIMGLGETGKATLSCLAEVYRHRPLSLHLLKYKNHAELMQRWILEKNLPWEVDIIEGTRELVRNSDVVVSCITYAGEPLAKDEDFRLGCLVVPVHTRGFQNCDLFFDKVFADDTSHVEGFQYFPRFKKLGELPAVLLGHHPGRENNQERILSYNIGIAIHDIVFAKHLFDKLSK